MSRATERAALVVWGMGPTCALIAERWRAEGGAVRVCPQVPATQQTHRAQAPEALRMPQIGAEDWLLLALSDARWQTQAIRQLVEAQVPVPRRVVALANLDYYGLGQGVIDEAAPVGQGAKALEALGAEESLRQWAGEWAVQLRAATAYDAQSGPIVAYRAKKEVPLSPPNLTFPLIHRADLAAAVLAALRHERPQECYLLSGSPNPTWSELYAAASLLLERPSPRFSAALPHPPVAYQTARMRADLLPEAAHPRWQEILIAAV